MKRKQVIIIISSLFALIIIAVAFWLFQETGNTDVYIVKKGSVTNSISAVGEINGGKSTQINMPEILKDWQLRVYQYKISDIVQEGKLVEKGEYVLKFDESELMNNMRNQTKEKEKIDADLKHSILDSTVTLTGMREDIKNLLLDLEYEKIDLEQSKFESKAYQRKSQMRYQKAEIKLEKKKRDYQLEQNKLKIRIMRKEIRVKRIEKILKDYKEAMMATRIVSPGSGILMFEKDYTGTKYSKDSQVRIWMRTSIAYLPDMSTVVSVSKLKEIDVTKVHINDSVDITIDALPDKHFTGKVVKIANMGEDSKNFDMKVFEIKIQLDYSDKELKPGMTSNNEIILGHAEDVLIVPVNAVFYSNDLKFVYKKHGDKIERVEVETGIENDDFVEIVNGLNEGDKILTYNPEEVKVAS